MGGKLDQQWEKKSSSGASIVQIDGTHDDGISQLSEKKSSSKGTAHHPRPYSYQFSWHGLFFSFSF